MGFSIQSNPRGDGWVGFDFWVDWLGWICKILILRWMDWLDSIFRWIGLVGFKKNQFQDGLDGWISSKMVYPWVFHNGFLMSLIRANAKKSMDNPIHPSIWSMDGLDSFPAWDTMGWLGGFIGVVDWMDWIC